MLGLGLPERPDWRHLGDDLARPQAGRIDIGDGVFRNLPEPKAGDLLAIMTAGAYGAVQSGFYNTRALVPEVLVKDDQYAVVRPRIEVEELIAMDRPAPWL